MKRDRDVSFTEYKDGAGKTVVGLKGRLDSYDTTRDFRDLLESLDQRGTKCVILDLNEVTAINSHGIAKILVFYERMKRKGGGLYVVEPMKGIARELFTTFHLNSLIEGYRPVEI